MRGATTEGGRDESFRPRCCSAAGPSSGATKPSSFSPELHDRARAREILRVCGVLQPRIPVWHAIQSGHRLAVLVSRFGPALRAFADAATFVVDVRAGRAADSVDPVG